jgi:hypothetical protein
VQILVDIDAGVRSYRRDGSKLGQSSSGSLPFPAG